MTEKTRFVARTALIHIVTYILCGMFFSTVLNYREAFTTGVTASYMRPMESSAVLLGPLLQIVRGILFGLVLLLFRDSFMGKKLAWLRLWAIMVVLGIINTPGPAPASIEGLIYTQIPVGFQLAGSLEILTQTLIFSLLVTAKPGSVWGRLPADVRKGLTAAIIGVIGVSLSGILLAVIIQVPVTAGLGSPIPLIMLAAEAVIFFFITRWFLKKPGAFRLSVFTVVSYLLVAAVPTAINYLIDSELASPVALVTGLLPAAALFFYINAQDSSRKAADSTRAA